MFCFRFRLKNMDYYFLFVLLFIPSGLLFCSMMPSLFVFSYWTAFLYLQTLWCVLGFCCFSLLLYLSCFPVFAHCLSPSLVLLAFVYLSRSTSLALPCSLTVSPPLLHSISLTPSCLLSISPSFSIPSSLSLSPPQAKSSLVCLCAPYCLNKCIHCSDSTSASLHSSAARGIPMPMRSGRWARKPGITQYHLNTHFL